MGSMDPYNWFYEMVLERYPGAYEPMDAAYDDQGRPQAYLIYALLVHRQRTAGGCSSPRCRRG